MAKSIKANTKVEPNKQYILTNVEAKILGIQEQENKAFVALKYFDGNYQCFSDWSYTELKDFTSFVEKVNNADWNTIYNTGSKGQGGKTGLGYTVHKNKDILPKSKVVDDLSEDITFFELRINQKARAHGFRVKSAFFLVWLDKDHQFYRM